MTKNAFYVLVFLFMLLFVAFAGVHAYRGERVMMIVMLNAATCSALSLRLMHLEDGRSVRLT